MKRSHVALVCLALLVAGLALRLPGLDGFLTPDEGDWGKNTAQFVTALLQRNWPATLTFAYPGVTVTWAGATGLALKSLLNPSPSVPGLAALAAQLAAMPDRLDLLPWLRLPVVLASVLGILAIYLLARRLLGEVAALLGAVLLALDPFFLAHSRLIQTDALLTIFCTVAWLAFLLASREGQRRFYILSGVALGAAVLTKSPAIAIVPLMAGWLVWYGRRGGSLRAGLRVAVSGLLWLGVPALLTFWLFWPALWVAPGSTIARVVGLVWAFGTRGHELGSYWLGQPVDAPGLGFYGAVLLWRTTPVTLPGLLLAVVVWVRAWWRSKGRASPDRIQAVTGLWLFLLWFALVVTLSDKKFDRYLLPVFPAVDLLAAWGWVGAVGWLLGRTHVTGPASASPGVARRPARSYVLPALVILLVLVQATVAWTARPYYLTAFNPIAGGAATARNVMLVGWGEGLPEAAQFLNRLDGASAGRAATWYGQNIFHAFYHGQSYDLYYDARTAKDLYARDVDYVVTYLNQEQRGLVDPTVQAKLGRPLFTSRSGDLALASVYRWPKPFSHTADRVMGSGMRLLGWDIGPYDSKAPRVDAVLYWDAEQLPKDGPGASVLAWLKDDTGQVWATTGPSAPSGQHTQPDWQGRQAVSQALTLQLPAGLLAGTYTVEIAVSGSQSLSLGDLTVAPTSREDLASMTQPGQTWQRVADDVIFGEAVQLTGYDLKQVGQTLILDELWASAAGPVDGYQFFVHVVAPDGRIVAQADGPLVRLEPGNVVRQRIHLDLSTAPRPAPYRVYTGLYRPPSGPRFPLTVGREPVDDGRFLLTTLPEG